MSDLLLDIRYALRSFARQRSLTLIAVVSLGLGIGATATVFTWLEGMVLNPLPAIPQWNRLVVAHTRAPEGGPWSVSWPDFLDWRSGSRSVDWAAWDMMQLGLRHGTEPAERAWGQLVSGNYFEALDVRAALGRVLRSEDEQRREPVAVLGHGYWQRRFAGDSGVIGRTVSLNGASFTIVGVAAERFVGNYVGLNLHFYLPMTTLPLLSSEGPRILEDRRRRSFEVLGRLRPEASVAQAGAELDPLALRAGTAAGLAQPLGAMVRSHGAVDAPGAMRPLLGALLVIAGLVLLIACANVANLLLARAVARRREVAVRLAIGASRYRLVRQLLTESLALAALAGVFGLWVTSWGREAMLGLLPVVPYPVGLEFQLNERVLLFAVLVTTLAAVAFGLVPALQASKPDLVPTLKDEIGDGAGGRGRLQGALVVAQVALSLVTLVTAGLFVRSLGQVRSIDTGMPDMDRVLLVGTDLSLTGLKGDTSQVAMVHALLERVRALPGARAATAARTVPLGPAAMNTVPTRVEGYVPRPDENMNISSNDVAGDYFAATGIALVDGRGLNDADMTGNAPVVVVNEAFVRRFLAGRPALGARLNVGGDEWLSVVGVVATTKVNDHTEDPVPVIYRVYSPRFSTAGFTLYVRAAGDPLALTPAVRGAFIAINAELPFLDPRTMAEFTTIPYWPQKVGALLLGAVGTLALLLASIGIYGAMAYAVSRRTREIGVRVALGAARRDVVHMVVGRGLRLTTIGLAIGLALSLAVGRALRSQLYGVSPRDPVTLAGVGLLLMAVALAACAVPARRAAQVDPMVALRSE